MRSKIQTAGLIVIVAAFVLHFLRPILPMDSLMPPGPLIGTGIGWPFLGALAGGLIFVLGSLLPGAPAEPRADDVDDGEVGQADGSE